MKIYCLAFLAIGSVTIAAEPPQDLSFKSTTIGLPDLKLSNPSALLPATSTALILLPSTRQIIIRDFESDQGASAATDVEPRIRRRPKTDLIGRETDREKLVEEVKVRAEKEPNQHLRATEQGKSGGG